LIKDYKKLIYTNVIEICKESFEISKILAKNCVNCLDRWS